MDSAFSFFDVMLIGCTDQRKQNESVQHVLNWATPCDSVLLKRSLVVEPILHIHSSHGTVRVIMRRNVVRI